ncbi:MAG: TIGR02281 family clan AA aspartic protease [Gammaproteobacteria bacterium]|nr:TIGR02281 family clan AA aspartic protease [Gammaproteobacteria bacterium]MDH5778905.1 TIGR02281 family clan AA aspartic protease [Gammaproteobacteria bacterium]
MLFMCKKYLLRILLFSQIFLIPAYSFSADILILGLFKDMAILRINNVQHKLKTGQTSPEGVKLIEANSEEAILEIDGKRQVYALGSHVSASTATVKRETSVARIWAHRGMFTTAGSINGQTVNFLVDTGATWVAMNTAQAKRLGINYRYEGKKATASTANGVARTYIVKLKSVKVGEIELTNVDGAVLDGKGPNTVLLGMSFLNKVRMQRDGKVLLLEQKH